MTTAPNPTDLGGFSYGEYAVFTLTFARNGTPQNPSPGPLCKLTPQGGTETDYTSQLSALGSGLYQFVPVTTVSGQWTGRIYSTGAGQTSRDIIYEVATTQNP